MSIRVSWLRGCCPAVVARWVLPSPEFSKGGEKKGGGVTDAHPPPRDPSPFVWPSATTPTTPSYRLKGDGIVVERLDSGPSLLSTPRHTYLQGCGRPCQMHDWTPDARFTLDVPPSHLHLLLPPLRACSSPRKKGSRRGGFAIFDDPRLAAGSPPSARSTAPTSRHLLRAVLLPQAAAFSAHSAPHNPLPIVAIISVVIVVVIVFVVVVVVVVFVILVAVAIALVVVAIFAIFDFLCITIVVVFAVVAVVAIVALGAIVDIVALGAIVDIVAIIVIAAIAMETIFLNAGHPPPVHRSMVLLHTTIPQHKIEDETELNAAKERALKVHTIALRVIHGWVFKSASRQRGYHAAYGYALNNAATDVARAMWMGEDWRICVSPMVFHTTLDMDMKLPLWFVGADIKERHEDGELASYQEASIQRLVGAFTSVVSMAKGVDGGRVSYERLKSIADAMRIMFAATMWLMRMSGDDLRAHYDAWLFIQLTAKPMLVASMHRSFNARRHILQAATVITDKLARPPRTLDLRYRDRNWVRSTRKWPPKLVKALGAFLDVKPV
ncbi:hypothetical protein CBR_g23277 [Chara braunii]|uniref:Uncharacterized protein n=1 Tax=Chara braunii TaxID=69332 RepID=A0A388JVI0_CHABU|nr:hypothetical protein CBR_g23277 [Chara braunii]|eukprot:GBG61763.1 hypothetical protein CBR_g23277 [Chara braunii]